MTTILLCHRLKGNEKALRETQTLRAKTEPKNFAPSQPFPGARDSQNLISWRWSLPLPKNPVWWGSMHAISSYRGNRPKHPPTNTARLPARCKQTGPITIHCATPSVQCNQVTANVSAQWHNVSHCARREYEYRVFSMSRTVLFLISRHAGTTFVRCILHVPRSQLRGVRHFVQEMMYRFFLNTYYHSYCSLHSIHTCCVCEYACLVSGAKIPVVCDCVRAG